MQPEISNDDSDQPNSDPSTAIGSGVGSCTNGLTWLSMDPSGSGEPDEFDDDDDDDPDEDDDNGEDDEEEVTDAGND